MNFAATIIILLLTIIAYFLYHIAQQLSYLTGKRLKITFFHWHLHKPFPKTWSKLEKPEPKLPN